MNKGLILRTTKFPYFFWGFNKAYTCELDFTNHSYKNLEKGTQYSFKPFNFYTFLALKYLPILIAFYFCFSIYDFNFNKRAIVAYVLAFILALSINFLDNLSRKVTSIAILVLSLLIGIFINDYFLIAYVLKYLLLFSVILIFYLDLHLQPFSLLENNKIISHFLINKTSLKENV